jgi:hypothetical protein
MKCVAVVLAFAQLASAASSDINVKYTFPLTNAVQEHDGDAFYSDIQRQMDSQASLVSKISSKASFVQGPQGASGDLSATVSEVIDAADHIMQGGAAAGSQETPANVADVARSASAAATEAASTMSNHGSFLQSPEDLHAFITEATEQVNALKSKLEREQAVLSSALAKKADGLQGAEVAANACNYMRLGAENAYQNVNKVVYSVGRVVAKMCGCIMVSKVAACALDRVAETCNYPYQAYANLYASSSQLWEAVKATTSQCRVIGAASVASAR